jgi:thiol-disulfide isomerase/thioredoxin
MIVMLNVDSISCMRSACLIGLVLTGLICFGTTPAFAMETSVQKTPAPTWELKDLNGKLLKSSDFLGKVVILDLWATWCAPCRVEIPHFVELQKQYGSKGLAIIGVSLDEQGAEVVKKFVRQFGVTYPIVMGSQKAVEACGGIVAVPTTFVIDRQGRIVNRHIGYDNKEVFEKEIQSLL